MHPIAAINIPFGPTQTIGPVDARLRRPGARAIRGGDGERVVGPVSPTQRPSRSIFFKRVSADIATAVPGKRSMI